MSKFIPHILISIITAIFVNTFTPTNLFLSPYDEYVYLDYVDKFSGDHLFIKQGELTGAFARKEISCHQIWRPTNFFWGQECDGLNFSDNSKYPWAGVSSAHLYTPIYFSSIKFIGAGFNALNDSQLTNFRLANYFWLTLGLIILFESLKKINIKDSVALGIVFLLLCTPAIYWSSTYVTPDAMALFIGSVLVFATYQIMKLRINPFWLVPLALMAVAVKSVFILGALASITSLIIGALHFGNKSSLPVLSKPKFLLSGLFSLCAIIVFQSLWASFVRLNAIESAPDQGDRINFTVETLLNSLNTFLGHSFDYGHYTGLIFFVGSFILNLFGFSALAISAINNDSDTEIKIISASTLIVVIFAGPLLLISSQVTLGYAFNIGPRYGLVLLPFIVFVLANLISQSNVAKWLIPKITPVLFALLILYPLSNVRIGYSPLQTILGIKFEILALILIASIHFAQIRSSGKDKQLVRIGKQIE